MRIRFPSYKSSKVVRITGVSYVTILFIFAETALRRLTHQHHWDEQCYHAIKMSSCLRSGLCWYHLVGYNLTGNAQLHYFGHGLK